MIIKKLGTVVATAALFASVMTPAAFASTTVVVSGNGANSDNDVHVTNEHEVTVSQNNTLSVVTSISQTGNTGGNDASGNTGGNVSITTGKVVNTADVTVQGGDNSITLPENCTCGTDTTVKVKGNGNKSETDVNVKNEDETKLTQTGGVAVSTGIGQTGDSGNNKAKNNTGKKVTISVTTKKVKNSSSVSVAAGSNTIN